jgi:uncharacterized membrane protein
MIYFLLFIICILWIEGAIGLLLCNKEEFVNQKWSKLSLVFWPLWVPLMLIWLIGEYIYEHKK